MQRSIFVLPVHKKKPFLLGGVQPGSYSGGFAGICGTAAGTGRSARLLASRHSTQLQGDLNASMLTQFWFVMRYIFLMVNEMLLVFDIMFLIVSRFY
jgi:hypothetical protein